VTTRWAAVLFDLDGTLLDTLDDLADSMNSALESMGYPTHDVAPYRHFVGEGIGTLARRALPPEARDEATVLAVVDRMRHQYLVRWHDKTKPYDGVESLLSVLPEAGLRIGVFSNKPDDFTQIVVKHFFPACPWSAVRGAKPGLPRKPSPDGALAIADDLGIAPENFVYVGDSDIDMQAALAAGMFAVGAAWGFRGRDELANNGANAIIDRPGQLIDVLRTA
jgi:phosphoglycolate phosphatase